MRIDLQYLILLYINIYFVLLVSCNLRSENQNKMTSVDSKIEGKTIKFVVTLNKEGSETTHKLTTPAVEVQTLQSLKSIIAASYALDEAFELEYYDNIANRFVDEDELQNRFDHLITSLSGVKRVVVNLLVADNTANQLMITGRQHNVSSGLELNHSFIGQRFNVAFCERSEADKGTGFVTWDGSVVLAKYFDRHPELVLDKRVIELGAGTGVVGISTAVIGSRMTLLTDLAYTLDNLKLNVDSNLRNLYNNGKFEDRLADYWGNCVWSHNAAVGVEKSDVDSCHEHCVFVKELDWLNKSTNQNENITVHSMAQITDVDVEAVESKNSWDVVVGADIVWLEHLIEPLVSAIVAHCSASTTLFLSHQTRSQRADTLLFDQLGHHFDLQKVPENQYHPDFSHPKISIFVGKKK